MLKVEEKVSGDTTKSLLKLVEPIPEKLEVREYLDTYLQLHNNMVQTYEWMKSKLDHWQKQEWDKTVEALNDIVRALDAGFEPCTPPRNWASGQLVQYIAPIPEQVRRKIDIAESIFGKGRLLIYDPNVAHFSRPKKTDPLAIGFIDLAEERIHFLVGQWDLAGDLKFISGSKRARIAARTVTETLGRIPQIAPSSTPYIHIGTGTTTTEFITTTNSSTWFDTSLISSGRSADWVARMTTTTT